MSRSAGKPRRSALHPALKVLQEAPAESERVYNAPGDELPSRVYRLKRSRQGEPFLRSDTAFQLTSAPAVSGKFSCTRNACLMRNSLTRIPVGVIPSLRAISSAE